MMWQCQEKLYLNRIFSVVILELDGAHSFTVAQQASDFAVFANIKADFIIRCLK